MYPSKGPAFGYYPKPTKSYIVVDSEDLAWAEDLFYDLGVKVVTSHRILGGVIGDKLGQETYVKEKFKNGHQKVKEYTKGYTYHNIPRDTRITLSLHHLVRHEGHVREGKTANSGTHFQESL